MFVKEYTTGIITYFEIDNGVSILRTNLITIRISVSTRKFLNIAGMQSIYLNGGRDSGPHPLNLSL